MGFRGGDIEQKRKSTHGYEQQCGTDIRTDTQMDGTEQRAQK